MENDAETCDECRHHPWKRYMVGESNWYSRAVHECKCKCHSIPKNKKLIKFDIKRSDDLWRSSDFRLERSITKQGYKIVTKRQWEEFKKRHSWTGKWKNYKRIRDESRAFEEAKRQGVIGYREDIPLLNANRSNGGHWGKNDYEFVSIPDGKVFRFSRGDWGSSPQKWSSHIMHVEKLVVCPVCKKSEFDDSLLNKLDHLRYRRELYGEKEIENYSGNEVCMANHKHDMTECTACHRRICHTAFVDYFGYSIREISSHEETEVPVYEDFLTIEKIWGSSGHYVGESDDYRNRSETGQKYLDIFDL